MFRRRPFRRTRIGPRLLAPLADRPRQMLQEAHRLMDAGQYAAAAQSFDILADAAQARGMTRRAPYLFIQAGRSHLRAGQPGTALDSYRRGLEMLAQAGHWLPVHTIGQNALAEFHQHGQTEPAAQLQSWLSRVLQGHTADLEVFPASQPDFVSPSVPSKCPYCGASLRSDEVEWIDQVSIECPYCGSSVQAGR